MPSHLFLSSRLPLLVFLPLPEAFWLNLSSVSVLSPKLKANLGSAVYELSSSSDFIFAPNCRCNETIFKPFFPPQITYFSLVIFPPEI